jgi:hypothetical protein
MDSVYPSFPGIVSPKCGVVCGGVWWRVVGVFAAAVEQLRRRCCSGCAGVLLKRLCGMV